MTDWYISIIKFFVKNFLSIPVIRTELSEKLDISEVP
jgi:hypothetical protein